MPDVKAPPCDYSPAGCSVDLERCLGDHPASLSVLGPPLAAFRHAAPPCPGPDGPPTRGDALLTNLGLRYCSTSTVHPPRQAEGQASPGPGRRPPQACRLYRSMENLHWAVSDPGLYAYRSSELILRCTSASLWYDGPPEGTPLYPRRGPARKDVPLFPQWLLPAADEWATNGNARKGLREKLRLQSARATEPHKPLRPQVTPGDMGAASRLSSAAGGGQRAVCARRITSPEDIKQEVRRRLQLHRQRSTPNLSLALLSTQEHGHISKSCTSDPVTGLSARPTPERPRPPVGRLHIPTFEEFKRMRQREIGGSQGPPTAPPTAGTDRGEHSTGPGSEEKPLTPAGTDRGDQGTGPGSEEKPLTPAGTDRGDHGTGPGSEEKPLTPAGTDRGDQGTGPGSEEKPPVEGEGADSGERAVTEAGQNDSTSKEPVRHTEGTAEADSEPSSIADVVASPICTGPAPRPPLHPSAAPAQDRDAAEEPLGYVVTDGSVPPFPPRRENSDAPSSCCPALLLDGTELSSYGAKIYKMKDGFLVSALDLIKKSCGAEMVAEAPPPVRWSREREDGADITAPRPDRQSAVVAMATLACGAAEARDEPAGREAEEPAGCHSGPGCRRSSSDAAYEPAESVRAQRECRLRPHFSDPMPADAAKRKQLEMKIAAAARFHGQRRDRDGASITVRGHSEPRGEERAGSLGVSRGEERAGSLGVSRAAQHRWSTISSMSADSGVVGLSDEREDDDEPHRTRRSAGAEVERVDSGIGPGLARGWKRPSASLRAWEAQRPCPDCGQREGARGDGICERCSKLRTERKEAILEFLNTESSYGEDLRIIKEEFYCPMQSAGLLAAEQLAVVFGNVQELIDVNDRFTEHLQDSIDHAFDQGDEDLLTVGIGEIFLEFVNMLPAFQTYCLQQSTSVNMLNTLEKEKELLRIFLDVSQNDNTALRRMNLRSFLMAPLQRVTKYPLLLSRISKATAECHPDHARLREAKSRVESHLEHINMKTKQEGTATWSLRSFRRDSRKNREVINIEMREMSMKTVGWTRESTRFVMEGPLQLSQPADGQWVKKGSKGLKFQNVQSLLMVHAPRPPEGGVPADGGLKGEQQEPADTVRDGVLVLIKDKSSGKFTVLREPIRLGNCVVSADPDCDDTFELLDIRREAFVIRASDKSRTQQWYRQIKRYACDLGPWRKRRNALPNIMINTTQNRS